MPSPYDSGQFNRDSLRATQEWKATTRPPDPNHSAQVAITVLDMLITIAPVVLLAAIWSKLNEMLMELRGKK